MLIFQSQKFSRRSKWEIYDLIDYMTLLTWNKSHLISMNDLSREEIELILHAAKTFEKKPPSDLLKGLILASCFFEPSTRTRLSFETAMLRLGGSCIGFSESGSTSIKKGESLFDTMRVIGSYADILVLRHPSDGAARLSTYATQKPLINAGDGSNQHPSQTLIDLFTIEQTQGKLDNLNVVLAGDLKFGRTVHSLSLALAHFGARLYFVSSEMLHLPESIQHFLRKKGVKFSFHHSLEDVLAKADIIYMTRIQKERFESGTLFENSLSLKLKHLAQAKENLKILHPGPRNEEIEKKIDDTPFAAYFEQAANGICVRMALLALLLKKL
jgi:aspartate carbamoyltransferase catalytic subunit